MTTPPEQSYRTSFRNGNLILDVTACKMEAGLDRTTREVPMAGSAVKTSRDKTRRTTGAAKPAANTAGVSRKPAENSGSQPQGKNIVLLSDGTGNSRAKVWKSNIWRLYKALDLTDDSVQVAYYDDGVGTSSFKLFAVLGGIFGFGLARNVREIYAFLCRTYEPGDRIYIFGFSRGAFTARVLAGLICSEGIPPYRDEVDLAQRVHSAYKAFRHRAFGTSIFHWLFIVLSYLVDWALGRGSKGYDSADNQEAPVPGEPATEIVHFMGLFDTVGAYGGPIEELTVAFDKVVWPLTSKDRNISGRIGRVCHALALDEARQSFKPMLINEEADGTALLERRRIRDERISQVWFSGVHSDIGGGYPDDGQSHVVLKWMMQCCKQFSDPLRFIPEEETRLDQTANFTARINDSRSGVGAFYRYDPRNLELLSHDRQIGWTEWIRNLIGKKVRPNVVSVGPAKIHHSVLDRIRHSADLDTPINLPADYRIVNRDGDILKLPEEVDPGWVWEDVHQAATRLAQQKVAWIRVWRGRLLYFITLFTVFMFFVVPWIGNSLNSDLIGKGEQEVDKLNSHLGTLSGKIIRLPDLAQKLTSFLPGSDLLAPTFEFYGSSEFYSWVFLGLVGLFAVLLWRMTRNQTRLQQDITALYAHLSRAKPSSPFPRPSKWRKLFASWINSNLYQRTFKQGVRFVLRFAAAIVMFLLCILVLSRIFYLSADGLGLVCAGSGTSKPAHELQEGGQHTFRFHAGDPCQKSGIKLGAGKYRIEIAALVPTDKGLKHLNSISEKALKLDTIKGWKIWSDSTLNTRLDGWRDRPWWSLPMAVMRRHVFVDWYLPVARIGNTGFYRFPLVDNKTRIEEIDPSAATSSQVASGRSTGTAVGGTQVAATTAELGVCAANTKPWNKRNELLDKIERGKTRVQQLTSCFRSTVDAEELYLHVNDAIGPVYPIISWMYYGNNEGHAEVRVTKLAD